MRALPPRFFNTLNMVPTANAQQRKHSGLPCQGPLNYKMIKIPVTNVNGSQFRFPQDDELQRSKIIAIEAFSTDDFDTAPDGTTPTNATVFGKAFLVLIDANGNKRRVDEMPLERLRAANNAGDTYKVCIDALNTGASFVQVPSIAGLVANETFCIGIHYAEKKEA